MIEMIAADRKGITVAAKDKNVQIWPRERDAAREGQGAAMNVMRSVRLDEIGETARAANARHGGDFFVPHLALLDKLEVQRENGEITTARAPCRVIGCNFFFSQTLTVFIRENGWWNSQDV